MDIENISPNVERNDPPDYKLNKTKSPDLEQTKSQLNDTTFYGNTIPLYDSSKSIDEHDLTSPKPKEGKAKAKVPFEWEFVREFPNVEVAQSSFDSSLWSRYRKNNTTDGMKVYYRCNQVKLRGPQCAAAVYHLFKNDSDAVLEYRTTCSHTHGDMIGSKEQKLRLENEVERLLKLKLKPKDIMHELSDMEGIVMPTRLQLSTIIAKIRKRIFGPVTISMTDLSAWLKEHLEIPESIHEPFVLCEEVNTECEEPYFRFMITTKYLLDFTKLRNFTHSDTTYKCIWQGFPVFMVGTTDWDKAYHPYAMCVCSNEKTDDFRFMFQGIKDGAQKILNFKMEQESVVCDAAFAIINAFQQVFGDNVTVIMCWFHAKTAMEDNLKIVKKENQKQILGDIEFLHIASTVDIFDDAADLFLRKWKPQEPQYCEYFENQWLIQHRNWFVGAADFTPCHNNALEASNRYLKDSHTIRIRHPLPHFLKVAMKTVGKWSKDYTIDLRHFATRPSINLPLWTSAYEWAKSNIPTRVIKETKDTVMVEVQAEVLRSKKRAAKDAVVVSESSSFQIRNFEKKRKIDNGSTAGAVTQEPIRTSDNGDVTKPQRNKRSQRKLKVAGESFSQPLIVTSGAATAPPSKPSKQQAEVASAKTSSSQRNKRSQRKSKFPVEFPVESYQIQTSDNGAATAAFSQTLIQTLNNGTVANSTQQEMKDVPTSSQSVLIHNLDHENFEEYKRYFHKWTVTVVKSGNSLYDSRCNCPAFAKEYICKHVIGLLIRLKLVTVPLEAKTVPIGEKRKRGRPSKTKPALMIQ